MARGQRRRLTGLGPDLVNYENRKAPGMGDEPFGPGPIGQIAVPVTDVARAVAFDRDTLGMRFLFPTRTATCSR
jgi:hypothetical protein